MQAATKINPPFYQGCSHVSQRQLLNINQRGLPLRPPHRIRLVLWPILWPESELLLHQQLVKRSCDFKTNQNQTPSHPTRLTPLILRDKLVTDLSPLKGMPLVRLEFYGTGVTDLRPLQGMSTLQTLLLTPQNITHGIEILRDMQSLKTIGIGSAANQAWPPAEFWARHDKGEFKE